MEQLEGLVPTPNERFGQGARESVALYTRSGAGFTIIEVLVGLAILGVVSTGIFQAYGSVLDIVQSAQYNSAALSIIETQVELVRNMRYEDVGTVGGVPAGKLPQQETKTLDGVAFTLSNFVRNIDDPFDGTLGGSPGDTAPADYKLVQFQITCATCQRYNIISMSTYVAPKNLESSSQNGNLFVRVFDASGEPVIGATVHVTNTQVSPPIDLTDITGGTGQLQLVDTATSSAGYHITVTKTGYTSDQTYPPGSPPNPLKPDATVANQQLTISSLAIDRVSTLTVRTRDRFCAPVAGVDFLMTGTKLIGTGPDTPKYSQSHTSNASGVASLTNMEWDSYTLRPTDTAWDIAGTPASPSLTMNPNTGYTADWLVASKSGNGLVVSVVNPSGVPLNDAVVRMTGSGYDETRITGESELTQTDWSDGAYDSKTTGLVVGDELTMIASAGGGSQWLISDTFDLGTSSATFHELNWAPSSQPPQADVKFQLAANNDDATWDFIGPDGTAGSFFDSPGQTVPSGLNGKRYLRYRVTLESGQAGNAPTVDDVSISFSSGCLLLGQSYFNALSLGAHTIAVSLPGYQTSSTPFTVSDSWARTVITLSP